MSVLKSETRINHAINAAKSAIEAADAITEPIGRKTKLLHLAEELPKTEEFAKLRLLAMRLALDIADTPRHQKASLEEIAKELPKSSDISFYRNYTLLGIAARLPKAEEFISLHKEAIQKALDAVNVIQEPYYREYALMYIAKALPKTEDYSALYKRAIEEASFAAKNIRDNFAKEHALIEIAHEIPKTPDFFELLKDVISEALDLYAAKNRLKDIDLLGRLDYLIAGEQRRLSESKKTRYTKEKYALILVRELEQICPQLNDIRFMETIRPFTHVWIQPARLRAAARKIFDHLENLRNTYHGKEIERPVFASEYHPASAGRRISAQKTAPKDCISIDLGATNTVIMRRKGKGMPEPVPLGLIANKYAEAYIVPSIINLETNAIGAEALEKPHMTNFKKMLLEDNPRGRDYMERYLRILYKDIKKAITGRERFLLFRGSMPDAIYIAVPVGFHNYRRTLKEIAERVIKDSTIEFIEEPLAAAIGYRMAEERDKVVALIDFGGCTFNTMMLRLNINEVYVISKPDRAQTLGGYDIDNWLAEHLANKIGMVKEDTGYDKLIRKAEEIKIALSEHNVAPFEWEGKKVCNVSRQEFEEALAGHDFYRIIDKEMSYLLKKAERVGVKKDMIEAVILTGGSSQIPSFKEKIEHLFPKLKVQNAIYSHSPLSAVAKGAALYPAKSMVTDRHLSMAYALRYSTKDKDTLYSYKLVLESGEPLPVEKTFNIAPARMLGPQDEIYLELFEIPESLLTRRWIMEAGAEFIKQEIKPINGIVLKGFKIIPLPFKKPINDEGIYVTFRVDDQGHLRVGHEKGNVEIETGIRLQ